MIVIFKNFDTIENKYKAHSFVTHIRKEKERCDMTVYKDYNQISLPNESADGYYMNKQKKQVEEFIYMDPEWYRQLFDANTFYILGPKGSGKTLYAAYMCAEVRNNTVSKSHTINVDDYGKLIAMKTKNHLNYTDYLTMWKVILMQKLLLGLDSREISFWGRTKSFQSIQHTISEYFGYDVADDSFNPVTVIDSCSKQVQVTEYLNNQVGVGGPKDAQAVSVSSENATEEKTGATVEHLMEKSYVVYTDTWLRSIDAFKKTLEKTTFKYNHFFFVDGLDVRPSHIDAREYAECIGALVRAVYDINMKILGNMKRKDNCEFRVIALTRTDIFLNSNLVNVTSCINDNCVELDWTYSNEKAFVYSKLYKMMNRVLGWNGIDKTMPVEQYFGFKLPYPVKRPLRADMYIQRQTRLRPRDVIVLLKLIQKECANRRIANPDVEVLDSTEIFSKYANYYTDQIKFEMMFNYSSDEIKSIFGLIKIIRKDSFYEDEFKRIYDMYCVENEDISRLFKSHRQLIDLFYSLDAIGWVEFFEYSTATHWHYREIKAIDETYRLPWEQFDSAMKAKFLIHKGACKHILGTRRK